MIFSAPSTSAGASAAQGRHAFVVPTFASTFLPPTPLHSLSIANMAPLLSRDSILSTLPLHQVSLSSARSLPVLNQPFIVSPGFTPVPAKTIGQVVVGKFVDLLLPSVASSEPEPRLLFDSRLVLPSTSKKPKHRVKDITTWMEAFSIYCLILTSFFPHLSKDLLQLILLILRTYRQFSSAYNRAFQEHAAAAKVVDWSSINIRLFNFNAAVSLEFPEPVGQVLLRSWSLCGLECIMSFCPSLFQLL